jgi:histidinol-phosphate aminotransferase
MSVSALPDVARRRLAALRVYQPGSSASTAAGKLSSNEAPLGPAPAVRAAIAASGASANRYPSDRSLAAALAESEGVSAEQVVLTNGSDELCYLIAALFIESGARVVLSDPSYQIDELVTRLAQGAPAFVPLREDGGHDVDGLAAAASDGAAVIWIPTPHNPTGVPLDPGELELFLGRVPEECIVVLDEAYRSYVEPALRPDSRRLIDEHPNLIVQRTFSKSYALAGLRLGYGLGSRELIAAIAGIRPPFSVNAAAIAAGEAALSSPGWADYAVELVVRERERLHETLSELGIEHFRSQANFVTVRAHDPPRLMSAMLEAGLAVRDGADLAFGGWVRISIGAPPEMASVRRVLREVFR